MKPILDYVCDFYLNIVDQLLVSPEGVVPHELGDRELFKLLSDFYLQSPENNSNNSESDTENLDFLLV